MAVIMGASLLLSGCNEAPQDAGAGNTKNSSESTQSTGGEVTETEDFAVEYPEQAVDWPVYVEAIPGIDDDFIRGMDASSVLVEENSGVTYYNYDGEEQDVFRTLAEAGINYIRLRVWNDPYDENGNGYGGGNNDVETAATLGSRATKYGMKVCIDFHYSDFWADPKRQHAPKAWEDMSLEEKEEALYEYTLSSLETLLDAGVDVGMVQIGNEINYGMSGETDTDKVITLLKAGSSAVREISEKYGRSIDIVVHYTDIRQADKLYKLVGNLEEAGLDYDIIGLSYYSFWHGSLSNMETVVERIRTDYGKRVVIAETSYCYTSEDGDGSGNSLKGVNDLFEGYEASVQGQTSMIRDVIASAFSAGAEGVFYWEGTWIPVGDASQNNSAIWEKYGSGWASSYAGDYDPEDAGLYYGGCSWDNQAMFDFDGYPLASLSLFKFLKYGTTLESAEDYTPIVREEAAEEVDLTGLSNLVLNPGFEDADRSMWTVTAQGTDPTDYFYKPEDSYTGDYSLHFYSGNAMEFDVSQSFEGLDAGTYYLEVYAQGGDIPAGASFELYAITSEGKLTQDFMLTTYIDWKHPVIPAITVEDGTLTIGIRVKTGGGSWGTFDDFGLYKLN